MPEFDPTIPMGVTTPQHNLLSPLETISKLTDVQKQVLDMRNLQMTLGAKAKAGQIMAGAPDLDSGIHALTQDPEVAGFVPDIIQTLQAVSSSQLAMQGEVQTQATSGLNSVMQSLLPALNDPTTFESDIAARLPTLSPSAQRAVMAAVPSIKAALFDGLSSDPATATKQYQQRLAAMMVGSGMGPDGVRAASGTLTPQIVTVKGPEGQDISMQVGGPMTGGPAGVIAQGPTTAANAEMAGTGEVAANIAKEMNDASASLPETLVALKNTADALGQMTTGGGADIRAGLGKALQFFKNAGATGISDDLINQVANGNLAASQSLTAYLQNFVTGQLRVASQGTGAGRIKSEVDAYLRLADTTTDPVALMNILNVAHQQLQVEYDRAQTYPEFKKLLKDGDPTALKYGPAGFNAWYDANKLDLNKLPAMTPAGQDIGPIKAPSSAGAKSGGTPSLDDIFGDSGL